MRKVLALAVVTMFCATLGLALVPGDKAGMMLEGTITKLDMTGRSMVVKSADGKETTVYWNEATKLEGVLKEGSTVHLSTMEKDGKTWASSVHVAENKY
jgi:hypothetical protein